MGVSYYNQNTNLNNEYPPIVASINRVLKSYIASVLYDLEPLEEALKRIIIANIDSDENLAFEELNQIGEILDRVSPFTAMIIGDFNPSPQSERTNHNLKSGRVYVDAIKGYAKQFPATYSFYFVTFFSEYKDYYTAFKKLGDQSNSLTRLYAPINLNGVDVVIPFNVSFELSNGQFTKQFEEWRKSKKIHNLQHNITVSYNEIICNYEITPIEEIEFNLINKKLNIDKDISVVTDG